MYKTEKINILITGKTGIGKSTLINQIFHGNFATTGQGHPITQGITEITKDGSPLAITDTRGLEIKEYRHIFDELRNYVSKKQKETDVNKKIHIAWICISEDSRRVEPAEIEIAEMLSNFMPVVVVITKARDDNGFSEEIKKIFPQIKSVVRVRSIEETIDGINIKLPQMGLDELINITQKIIHENAENAFTTTQKAFTEQKNSKALIIGNSTILTILGIIAGAVVVCVLGALGVGKFLPLSKNIRMKILKSQDVISIYEEL